MCWLLTYFLVLIQNELRIIAIGKKYAHVDSADSSCHICLHIYEDTFYNRYNS